MSTIPNSQEYTQISVENEQFRSDELQCESRKIDNYQIPIRKKCSILVGICSAQKYRERREAVRETWIRKSVTGIECLFFLGGIVPPGEEADVIAFDVSDEYMDIPAKVLAFYRYALDNYEFDWLFKCDDDTYLDLSRLEELADNNYEFIGDVRLMQRGAPSGGAGYFLSRHLLETIVKRTDIPLRGAEDLIFGAAAKAAGAITHSTSRLFESNVKCPLPDNDLVSSHLCPPDLLRAVHVLRHASPEAVYQVSNRHWQDELYFYTEGVFRRKAGVDYGWWNLDESGKLVLAWKNWSVEYLQYQDGIFRGDTMEFKSLMSGGPLENKMSDRCGVWGNSTIFSSPFSQKKLTVKIYEGFGNQLFQLAAGMGTAQKLNRLFVVNPSRIGCSHQASTDDAIWKLVREQFTVQEESAGAKAFYIQDKPKRYIDYKDAGEEMIVMIGYWQHSAYFSDCLDAVAESFSSLAAARPEPSRIALHLRLGDYYFHYRKCYHIVSKDYIRKTVCLQLESGASPELDVFTDRDSLNVASVLVKSALEGMDISVNIVSDGTDYDDFVRMTAYDHFIGAPSTFSWWACFLHRNVSKQHVVCFPRQFYKKAYYLHGSESDFFNNVTRGELHLIDDIAD